MRLTQSSPSLLATYKSCTSCVAALTESLMGSCRVRREAPLNVALATACGCRMAARTYCHRGRAGRGAAALGSVGSLGAGGRGVGGYALPGSWSAHGHCWLAWVSVSSRVPSIGSGCGGGAAFACACSKACLVVTEAGTPRVKGSCSTSWAMRAVRAEDRPRVRRCAAGGMAGGGASCASMGCDRCPCSTSWAMRAVRPDGIPRVRRCVAGGAVAGAPGASGSWCAQLIA